MVQRKTLCLSVLLSVLAGACANIVGLSEYRKERDSVESGVQAGDPDGGDVMDADTRDDARSDGEAGFTRSDAQLDAPASDNAANGAAWDSASGDAFGPDPGGPDDAGSCDPPRRRCGGRCVAANDLQHCGRCDHDCTQLTNVQGSVSCSADGQCVVPASSCAPGFGHCSTNPDDGCERDLSLSASCGECTTMCQASAPLCSNRAPSGSPPSYDCVSECGTSAPTKCGASCVDTSSSLAHCNGCNKPCSAPTGGTATCRESRCGFECNNGFHRCADSCARNDSVTQCGSQCLACPQSSNGSASCVSGSCQLSCRSGYVKRADRAECVLDTRPPCIKMPSQVILLGDAYVSFVSHRFPNQLATLSGQTWRNYAVADAKLGSGAIFNQYQSAIAADPNIHAVVMDGGFMDIFTLPLGSPSCQDPGSGQLTACQKIMTTANSALSTLFDEMVKAGIPDVVYFYYPQTLPNSSNEIFDYNRPKVKDLCSQTATRTGGKLRCTFVDLAPIFTTGDMSLDGLHPNTMGSQKMANAVWAAMMNGCIGQTSGSCCKP